MKNNPTRKLTVLAMICALGFIAMFFFRFNVGFLTFDFKDAILSVGALIYGPVAGAICSILVAVVESVTIGDTGPYGLIMDILSSSAFLIPCGIVYKYKRSFSGAIIAAVSSVIAVVAVMAIANVFITPLYTGASRSDVVGMLPTLLLPFNLSKGLMNASVMLLIYKPVTNILRKTSLLPPSNSTVDRKDKKSIILAVSSLVVLVLTAIFVVVVMKGNFTLFDA
ncbi:MAG: ECF transporter S component [Clostridia bacterium]|nr:ECF transporter S component [Clostridia bacterium]